MLFPQLPFQTTMFQHERLVGCWVQKSQTQLQIHPLIIVEMKWEQVQDDGIGIGKISWWLSSLLFCPEPNGQKIVVWNQWHRPDPGGKVRQPKLLRMIKWYKMAQPCCNAWCKMAQPCCNTLNQFDGNSSVRRIPNEQQQKIRQGGQKPCHCSNQRGGILKSWAQLGSCWDGLRLSFLNFKRIYVEGNPTEIVISWAMLFAWQCVSKHKAMKTNFGTLGPCLTTASGPSLLHQKMTADN